MNWTFQIGMLPRAGSAWLATLLNMHPGVFCFHDALSSFNGSYNKAAASKLYEHVGDSSSYCCLREHVDRAVYIQRDIEEVKASMEKLNLLDNFDLIVQYADTWSKEAPTFKFWDIFGKDVDKSVFTLGKVFDIVVPGVALNQDKVKFLKPLMVELLENGPDVVDIEEIKRRII